MLSEDPALRAIFFFEQRFEFAYSCGVRDIILWMSLRCKSPGLPNRHRPPSDVFIQ